MLPEFSAIYQASSGLPFGASRDDDDDNDDDDDDDEEEEEESSTYLHLRSEYQWL